MSYFDCMYMYTSKTLTMTTVEFLSPIYTCVQDCKAQLSFIHEKRAPKTAKNNSNTKNQCQQTRDLLSLLSVTKILSTSTIIIMMLFVLAKSQKYRF